MSTEQKQ